MMKLFFTQPTTPVVSSSKVATTVGSRFSARESFAVLRDLRIFHEFFELFELFELSGEKSYLRNTRGACSGCIFRLG